MPTLEAPPIKLLSPRDVAEMLKISTVSVDRLRRDDPTFPAPIMVRLRRSRWDRVAIQEWLVSRRGH